MRKNSRRQLKSEAFNEKESGGTNLFYVQMRSWCWRNARKIGGPRPVTHSMENLYFKCYCGSQLRFYGSNVSFCLSLTNNIMKTNKVPLKRLIKMLTEMQKKIWIFQNLLVFRASFEKAVIWGNGQIWSHSIFLNETFMRASSLRFIKNGGIVDGHGPHNTVF